MIKLYKDSKYRRYLIISENQDQYSIYFIGLKKQFVKVLKRYKELELNDEIDFVEAILSNHNYEKGLKSQEELFEQAILELSATRDIKPLYSTLLNEKRLEKFFETQSIPRFKTEKDWKNNSGGDHIEQ